MATGDTYISTFDKKGAETAHSSHGGEIMAVSVGYAVFDRQTRLVSSVHPTSAAAQSAVASLLAQGNYAGRLAIVTVPV